MEQARPKLVEVACFTEAYHADLARRFLRRSGVRATVPEPLVFPNGVHPARASPQRRLYVEEDQVTKARRLLHQVISGEFSEDDPLSNTRRGLGAALAEAMLPSQGYVPPAQWKLLAPIILIPLAFLAVGIATLIYRTFHPQEPDRFSQGVYINQSRPWR